MLEVFGVSVSDIQEDIEVDNNQPSFDGITGTSKYLSGSNAITDVWGEGNFIVLKFTPNFEYAKITVEIDPTAGSGPVELDEDMTALLKVTDHDHQRVIVTAYDENDQEIKYVSYPLAMLTCQPDTSKNFVLAETGTRDGQGQPAVFEFTATGYELPYIATATVTVDIAPDVSTMGVNIDEETNEISIVPNPLTYNTASPIVITVEVDGDTYTFNRTWPTY